MILGLKFRKTNSAIPGGELSRDGAEGEKRQGVKQTAVRYTPVVYATRNRNSPILQHDVIRDRSGGKCAESAVATAGEEAEEEVDRGGDDNSRSNDDDDDDDRGRGGRGRRGVVHGVSAIGTVILRMGNNDGGGGGGR